MAAVRRALLNAGIGLYGKNDDVRRSIRTSILGGSMARTKQSIGSKGACR